MHQSVQLFNYIFNEYIVAYQISTIKTFAMDDIKITILRGKIMVEICKTLEHFTYWSDGITDLLKTAENDPSTHYLAILHAHIDIFKWIYILNELIKQNKQSAPEEKLDLTYTMQREIFNKTKVLESLVSKDTFDKIQTVNSHFDVPIIPEAPDPPSI